MAEQKDKWMQSAKDKMESKGTVGSLTRAAKRADMSTMAFARKEKKSPRVSGLMKKKANFAINAHSNK